MKKVRSNARWNGLSKAQREMLEKWLFEDGLKYEEAWRRAQAELGFQGSVSSLKRFYVRRSQERVLEKLVETQEEAEAIVAAPATAGLFRSAAMKLVGQLFLRQVRDTPGEVKEWSALAKLMLWQEDLELRRQLKQEENEMRRENLAFAKERFHFNVVRRAEKVLPQLQELAEARKDPKLREYEEGKRLNAIIRNLFGSQMPKSHPESAEEEAAMEKAARGEKAEEEAGQAERVRQESAARREAEAETEKPRTTTRTTTSMADEEEQMVEISREELARMAQPRAVAEVVEEPGKKRVEEPVKLRPTCMTYQEWEKTQGPSSKTQY